MFQFSLLLSFGIALGFLKRYVTPSFLKGLRNGSWSKLEVWKKHQFYFIEGTFFYTSNFDQLPFLSPFSYKDVVYLFRKPKAILIESSNQNWKNLIHSVQKLALSKSGTFSFKSVLSHCGWNFLFLILKDFQLYSIFEFHWEVGRQPKLSKCFSDNQVYGISCPEVY